MALTVKKAESIGDLVVRQASSPNVVMGRVNAPNVVMGQAPQMNITGVQGAPSYVPNISGVVGKYTPPPVRNNLWDTVYGGIKQTNKFFYDDLIKSLLQGIASAPERLVRSTAGLAFKPGDQQGLRSDKILGIPGTEAAARILYGDPIETYQDSIYKFQQGPRVPDITDPNANIFEKGINSVAQAAYDNPAAHALVGLPLMAAMDALGLTGEGAVGRGASKTIEMTIANATKDSVKAKALQQLLRNELMGNTNIPVTKTGGGDVPIPVRVNKTIPVRYSPSDEVLDSRLSREVDIVSGRHEKELAAAAKSDAPMLNTMGTDTKYNDKYAELLAQREKGTLPQRIEVKDAPKPKKTKAVKAPKVKADKPPKAIAPYIDDVEYGKSPSLFNRVARTTGGVLEKNGTGGKAINRGVQKARDYAEKATSNHMADLEAAGFKDIDDDGFKRVWDAVEAGSAKGLSADERRVAAALVRTMNRVHKSAVNDAGMDIGDRGSTYLPHWYKENDKQMVSFFEKKFNKQDSNLEKKRLTDKEGYEKTKESIARYIQNANERIGRAKEFGQKDEKLAAMFDVARREGYDVKQVERYARTALGDTKHDSTVDKVLGGVRKYEGVTSLQRSFMANAGQPVNTAVIGGVKNWAKATYKYWSDPKEREWAKRSGAYGDHILGRAQDQFAGIGSDTLGDKGFVRVFKKHFLVPGMQAVEKFNRANGVLAGKAFAEDLLKKAAKGNKTAQRQLNDYFPDLKNIDDVTNEDIVDAAREFVKRSQFKVDPVDLPRGVDGSVGRLIFQFRSFGYKQTQFIAREVFGEALNGNFAPMARYLAVAAPVGYGIAEGKRQATDFVSNLLSPGKEEEKEPENKSILRKAFEGFLQIGGAGLLTSEPQNIINSFKYGGSDNKDMKGKLTDTIINTMGATVSDTNRLVGAIGDAVEGKYKKGAVLITSQLPIVGPYTKKLTESFFKTNTKDPSTMNADELDKYKKTTFAKFMDGLSDRDSDLMDAVNDSDYERLGIKSGKFTQEQVEEMQTRYNRELFKAGLPIKYVKGVTDEEFDTFTPELKALVMEASMIGTKKFAESKTYDKTAEAVMKKAMEQAWPEIGDIKGSNQMAFDYLQAQRDFTKAGDDQGKQFDIVKGFWGKAVKQQYPDKVKNIYSNSLADIKRLLEGVTVNGVKYQVSKADMDAAVALDDRLLASGLIDTPKFSNKTRAEYGYGAAGESKVSGVGYRKTASTGSGSSRRSGGSSGGSTKNPYAHTVSRGSKSTLSGKASASGGKASVKLASAARGGVAKPKVSRTKNKV